MAHLTIDGPNQQIEDTNGNELLKLGETASAVNEAKISNNSTGLGPIIEATGETNVPITLKGKGTGAVLVGPAVHGAAVAISWGRNSKALSDANYTMLVTEYIKRHLEFTGALTAGRDIILPLTDGAEFVVYNGTTGGFALTFKGATGTGVAVAATKHAIIRCDGTNYIRVTADT